MPVSEMIRRNSIKESHPDSDRQSGDNPSSSRQYIQSHSSNTESSTVSPRDRLSLRKRRPVASTMENDLCNGHMTDNSLVNGDSDSEVVFSPRVHRSLARYARTSTSLPRTPSDGMDTKSAKKVDNDSNEFSPRVHRSRCRFPRTTPTPSSGSGSKQRDKSTPPKFSLGDSPLKKESYVDDRKDKSKESGFLGNCISSETVEVAGESEDVLTEESDSETEKNKAERRRSGRLIERSAVGINGSRSVSGEDETEEPRQLRRSARHSNADDTVESSLKSSPSVADNSGEEVDLAFWMSPRRSTRIVMQRSRVETGPPDDVKRLEETLMKETKVNTLTSFCAKLSADETTEVEEEEEEFDFTCRTSDAVKNRTDKENGHLKEIDNKESRTDNAGNGDTVNTEKIEDEISTNELDVNEVKESDEVVEVAEDLEAPYEAPRLRKRRRSSTTDSKFGDVETSSSASTVAAIVPPAKRRRRTHHHSSTVERPEAISEDEMETVEEEEEEEEEEEDQEDGDDEEGDKHSDEVSEVSSLQTPQQTPRKSKAKKKSKPKDGEKKAEYYEFQRLYTISLLKRDPVCQECEKMGPPEEVFTCTAGCLRAFHQNCAERRLQKMQPKSSNPEKRASSGEATENCPSDGQKTEDSGSQLSWQVETFRCPECLLNRRRCFMCKEQGADSAPLICCSLGSCGIMYHEACLLAMSFTRQENRRLICPLHLCHACAIDNPASRTVRLGRMIRCIRCPVAYHAGDFCVAAGSVELSGNLIICPNHFESSMMKRYKTINTSWCLICSKGGTLICCEKCPASFHTDCIDVDSDSVPEKFVCDDCLQGRNPRYGEIVWTKLGIFRWWPSEVLHARNAPRNIQRLKHSPGEFAVHFFGSDEYCWIHRGRVFSFKDGDYEGKDDPNDPNLSRLKRWYARGIKVAIRAFNAWSEDREEKETRQDIKKPYPYRFIRNNNPVGNVKLHRPGELHELPRCDCDPSRSNPCSSDSECLNRMLMYECHPSICHAKEKCQNQRFMKREYPPQIIFRTTDNRGWGLEAGVDIKKGEFVNEYVGDLIDESEAMKRLQEAHENNVSNYYMLTLDRNRIIDAGPKGNLSRFINHSCSPLLETQKWLVNGDFRIGLFAVRDIEKGEELTFNYNFQSRGDEQCVCRCGAESCKGFLGDPIGSQAEKQQQELEETPSKSKQSKEKHAKEIKLKLKSKAEETPKVKSKTQQAQKKQKEKPEEVKGKSKHETETKQNNKESKSKKESKEKESQVKKDTKVNKESKEKESQVKKDTKANKETKEKESQNKKDTKAKKNSQTKEARSRSRSKSKSKERGSLTKKTTSKQGQRRNKKVTVNGLKSRHAAPKKLLQKKLKKKHQLIKKKNHQQTSTRRNPVVNRGKISRHDSSTSLESSCSSSEAEYSGPADTPNVRVQTLKKQKTSSNAALLVTDQICFRCGEAGETMCCDAEQCPKAYHLACLGLKRPIKGQWFCPWHHCDFCGRAASVLCQECTTSYCELHAISDIVTPLNHVNGNLGLILCNNHSPAPESNPTPSGEQSIFLTPKKEMKNDKGKENTTPTPLSPANCQSV